MEPINATQRRRSPLHPANPTGGGSVLHGVEARAAELDARRWQRGGTARFGTRPGHRTRTVWC